MLTYAATTASSALIPSHGAAAAWAGLPVKVALTLSLARNPPSRVVAMLINSGFPGTIGTGWTIRQASMPLYAPLLIRRTLPPPDSSAGVPSRRTVNPDTDDDSA